MRSRRGLRAHAAGLPAGGGLRLAVGQIDPLARRRTGVARVDDVLDVEGLRGAGEQAAIAEAACAACAVAESLGSRGVLGRFSTFLEHSKQLPGGERVTSFNALFHWKVPAGKELEAGIEVGRHDIMTHAYWRDTGPEFGNVNVMGVAHSSTDKQYLLDHKAAIDAHLEAAGIAVDYSNVFWGGRSEIKPSEISPVAYREWCASVGVDHASLRAT